MLKALRIVIKFIILVTASNGGLHNNIPIRFSPGAVEISPGRYLIYESATQATAGFDQFEAFWGVTHSETPDPHPEEWTFLKFSWQGKTIFYFDVAGPLSLREYQGKLYFIGFDRSPGTGNCRFRYFREEGNVMREIPYTMYPQPIAIQNMWFDPSELESDRTSPAYVDMTIRADPRERWFIITTTAAIWRHLLTGKDFYQQDDGWPPREELLEFERRYHPIRLTQIVPGRIPDHDWQPPGDADDEGGK